MNAEKERFVYHLEADPQLRFLLLLNQKWQEMPSEEIGAKLVQRAAKGVVAYPSGEILAEFGSPQRLPGEIHYFEGPVYQDDQPGYSKEDAARGRERVVIKHGVSRSRSGNPRTNYSTEVKNLSAVPIRVTKFAGLDRGLFGIKTSSETTYYSPTQFREWFRVSDPDGWIVPNQTVCDPDNWGDGNGVWAYFFEDTKGERFIGTVPLRNS